MSLSDQADVLLDRLRAGDEQALGQLFALYSDRLWRMVYMRLDRRLAGRVDPDDILQETFLDVARRIGDFLDEPSVPFYVWLRFLTAQRMQLVQRNHFGAQMRNVNREVSLPPAGRSLAGSESLAGAFVSRLTSPSQAAIRQEMQTRLRAVLEDMDPLDREVLALRHFEELSNQEAAQVLGISKEAASKRHVRALKRLKELFALLPREFMG
jgi:RNA polymerase sigma-70 factor (ECF subfamily)